MEENKVKVKKFLSRFFRQRELLDDEDIFALGIVNSLFAMQLVMFIEKEFELRVDNADLDIANFSSVNRIAQFVKEKSAV
jgi:acyl carrier protein